MKTVTTTRWFYNLYVFISGAAVMLLEFAASRLLAPYFGTSIFVWGNIIGAILIALSVGYFIGGKLADRKPDLTVVSSYVLAASVLVSLIPAFMVVLVVPLSELQTSFSFQLGFSIIGSFVAIVLLFALPVILLGMVSPFIIRIATKDIQTAGQVAGGLYAWSTLGSIVGTFASAFFIVPFLGSRETIFISALLLALIGIVGMKRYRYAVILVLPIVSYLWFSQQPLRADAAVLEEGETMYQYYAVSDTSDRLLLQYNEGIGTQSFYMKTGVLTNTYYDYLGLVPVLAGTVPPRNIAVLGLAGGTLTRQLTTFFPDSHITGVEIDGDIVDLAKRRFGLADQGITIVIDDARTFMQQTAETYDLIFVDAFTNEYYIPWHMTTVEFFRSLAEHQPAQGMVAMNIGSASGDAKLLQAMLTTIQAVYPNVYTAAIPGTFNYVVVAAKQPIQSLDPLLAITDERQGSAAYLYDQIAPFTASNTAPILTDNRAPVELYTEAMVWDYILDL
ncbi:MAG: fused MFS/spermidine synthase [Candidatus Kerfeldbacteria bacterium]|nr:fused MFS/spermidine synthase [Candidatus Kerfeldbacteria bacterium]